MAAAAAKGRIAGNADDGANQTVDDDAADPQLQTLRTKEKSINTFIAALKGDSSAYAVEELSRLKRLLTEVRHAITNVKPATDKAKALSSARDRAIAHRDKLKEN